MTDRKHRRGNRGGQAIWRLGFVFTMVFVLLGGIGWKIFDLQVLNNDFLQRQGDARTVRNDVIAAHRGNILDRNGEPLAISTPVQSLWLNPREVLRTPEQWPELAAALAALDINPEALMNRIRQNAEREFMYIKRRMPPVEANSILSRDFTGVYAQEEYKRYYPLGEVAVHVVGLANSDDVGQEGVELAYEPWLQGVPGSRQVLKDRLGGIIREVRTNAVAQPGNDLSLSIDSRIQYHAYRSLKEAVTRHHAVAGTAVVLDVQTGEVLAMVSQPSYNPNNRASLIDGQDGLKNRAIVQAIEPGSTVKTFTITAALESGLFDTESVIDTGRCIRVDRARFCDVIDYEEVTLAKLLAKSSQVGATKVGLAMGEEPMLDVLRRVGFGQSPGTGFPGESPGMLPGQSRWSNTEIATLAYGYGFQVTPLQLAQAYMIYANDGISIPVSLLKVEGEVEGERVISADIARTVTRMLEGVVAPTGVVREDGTGTRAFIPTHRVAGKTGTARLYDVSAGRYDDESHTALFAGFAPVSNPRIVTVVTIEQPRGEDYGGGAVAAPVFADITAGTLRILNVPPDIQTTSDFSLTDIAAPPVSESPL